jgi:hypothetical protein
MMADYYEVNILCTAEDLPGEFREFDERTNIFKSPAEIMGWLKDYYSHAKRIGKIYDGQDPSPCGYIYEFKDSDMSHAPAEEWLQRDFVTASKVHTEFIFEEIKYDE